MLEYQRVPQEREREVPDRKPPPEWPSAGVVEYRGVWMRYRDGLPPVLKARRGRGWVRWEGVGLCRAARAASPTACCTSSPPRRRAGSRPLPGLWCRAQGVTFAVGSAEKVGRWAWWATRVRVSRAGRHVHGGQRGEGGHRGPDRQRQELADRRAVPAGRAARGRHRPRRPQPARDGPAGAAARGKPSRALLTRACRAEACLQRHGMRGRAPRCAPATAAPAPLPCGWQRLTRAPAQPLWCTGAAVRAVAGRCEHVWDSPLQCPLARPDFFWGGAEGARPLRRMCGAASRPSRRSPSCSAAPSAATSTPTTSTRTTRSGPRSSASTSRRGCPRPQRACRRRALAERRANDSAGVVPMPVAGCVSAPAPVRQHRALGERSAA